MSKKKKVTIVIPNYNGIKFIDNCIKSLQKQTYPDIEVIVVDNNSVDESVNFINKHYPNIRIISLDKNYGFSKAVNVGIRESKTPYVILLNNDTETDERFVEKLVNAIEKSNKIFSVSSKMLSYDNRELMDDAGDYYTVIGWAFQRGVGQSKENYIEEKSVFSSCAGAAIYRKEIFKQIGLFDESHFAYLEDVDIGYRARIAGYKNIYNPDAIVYHIGSATSGSKYNDFKVKLTARNSIYLNYKNMPFLQIIINAIPLLFGYIIKTVFFFRKGYGKAYLKGLAEGLKTLSNCKKVKFRWKNILNYIVIEYELIINTLKYLFDLCKRKLF